MMFKYFLPIFFSYLVSAQFSDYKYSGVIMTTDSIVFPYEINVSKNFATYSGFSISDRGGKSETKTIFKITKAGDQLLFSEDRIAYTKADYSDFDDFCLVNFSLEEKKLLKSKKITINFEGKFTDGSSCVNGQMKLLSSSYIENKFTKAEKKITNSKIIRKKIGDSISMVVENIKQQKNRLLSTNEVQLESNDKLTFSVDFKYRLMLKDYSVEDGDKLKIVVNNKDVEYVTLTNTPVYINFNNKFQHNTIEINGISEGKRKSITSLIEIQEIDGKKKIPLKLTLKSRESAFLVLNH